jgi:threonyl-tRNA synthetase
LAPEQVRVLPLSEKTNEYAEQVRKRLSEAGFRVTLDDRSAKVQAKIRDAQVELIPYMVVVGPREAEAGAVALRDRIDGDLGAMPLAEAIAKFKAEVAGKVVRQVAQKPAAVLAERGEAHEY